jgi:DHA2 family multidrug resistance protein-like MFS transporter
VSETAYEVGAVLGTAVLGTILTASYRNAIVIPDGLSGSQAAAARETLGGATELAESLPLSQATQLLGSAMEAFDSGVVATSGLGVLLLLVAAVGVAVSLRKVGAA